MKLILVVMISDLLPTIMCLDIMLLEISVSMILFQEEDDLTLLKPNLSDISVLVVSAISQQGCSKELKGLWYKLFF